MAIDPAAAFVRDTRSPLARALGDRGVAVKIVDLYDGTGARLDGIPLALKAVPESARVKASADALRFLTGPLCGLSEEYLYGTDQGASEHEIQTKVYLLAAALCEPAPPHALVCADADALRGLLYSTEVTQLFDVYANWIAERNPIGQAKSLEEVELVLSALGKGMLPASCLMRFDFTTLRSALCTLAVQRETRTSSSSSLLSLSTEPPTTPPSNA